MAHKVQMDEEGGLSGPIPCRVTRRSWYFLGQGLNLLGTGAAVLPFAFGGFDGVSYSLLAAALVLVGLVGLTVTLRSSWGALLEGAGEGLQLSGWAIEEGILLVEPGGKARLLARLGGHWYWAESRAPGFLPPLLASGRMRRVRSLNLGARLGVPVLVGLLLAVAAVVGYCGGWFSALLGFLLMALIAQYRTESAFNGLGRRWLREQGIEVPEPADLGQQE